MIKKNLIKLKKYLFLISLFVFFVVFVHILYKYIYSDAKSIPIDGGSVSEGIVGEVSRLNPLVSSNDYDKYIMSILYRSLLKYDTKNKKLVSDLANCDVSNLTYVECFLENNIYWSDKSAITADDVIATYNILKTTNVNPIMKSLLADTTIEEKNGSIIFKNSKKNINFLNIFFQPILSKKVIDSLGIDELSKSFISNKNSLYSGKYKFSAIEQDKNLGIDELVLEKNDNYFNNNTYLGKIIFKFFDSNNSLIKNKDVINIFNDDESVIGESVPRLESHYYMLPKYTTLFINEEKMTSKSLRNFILNKIDREKLIKILGSDKYKEVKNPYLTDYDIDEGLENKNIESIMESLGYYKKSELAKLVIGNDSTTKTTLSVDEIEKKENTTLKYIISGLDKKYRFVNEDNILLKGDTLGENPDAIYINDYKIQAYNKGDEYFYYRLLSNSTYDTIEEGRNDYKLYFEKDGKKELKEEFTVFYYKDSTKLSQVKKDFYTSLEAEKTANIQETTEEVKQKQKKEELNKKLEALDDKYYYNKNFEKYSIKLLYIGGESNMEQTSGFIKEVLGENGIYVDIQEIALSDLSKFVSQENSSQTYDMVLAGINLGNFDFNIYPYFHSSQAKTGYNFSNIKKLSLDVILEDINSHMIYQDGFQDKEKKALNIIRDEQVIKTLYTPMIDLLIDKNIKNVDLPENSSGQIDRVSILSKMYVNGKREINYKNKGIGNFFKFLYHIITG